MKSKVPNKRARLDPSMTSNDSPIDPKLVQIKTEPGLAVSPGTPQGSGGAKSSGPGKVQGPVSTNAHLLPTYPAFNVPDLTKDFPKISSLLAQAMIKKEKDVSSDQGPVPIIEDLDGLQIELETLWSLITVRIRVLEQEKNLLNNLPTFSGSSNSTLNLGEHYDLTHQEKINAVKSIIDSGHGTRTSVSAAARLVMGSQPASPAVSSTSSGISSTSTSSSVSSASPIVPGSSRKSNNSASAAVPIALKLEKQPKKKLKVETGSKASRGGPKPCRAGQNRSHSMSLDDSFLRQEAPNQFWEFADTYCKEVTSADMAGLEKMRDEHKAVLSSDIFEISPLGKHFKDGKGKEANDIANQLKVKERRETRSRDVCGPLTQRLVAALVEDRVSNYHSQHSNGTREDPSEGFFINRPGLVRALGLDGATPAGGPPLEARLRQVLLEQGVLLGDDAEEPTTNPDDEILREIKRTQSFLRKLHQYNSEKLDELVDLSKKELEREPLKKELAKADKEVIDAYRTLTSFRIKKKLITKKEKDAAIAALQARKVALEKLDS